jgi:hypothetical protein
MLQIRGILYPLCFRVQLRNWNHTEIKIDAGVQIGLDDDHAICYEGKFPKYWQEYEYLMHV